MATARELALNALLAIERGAFCNSEIASCLEANPDLSSEERKFFVRLTEGTTEERLFLDYVINSFSNTKVNKMKPVIRNLLRMGVYQILFMDRIPDSAAINESVKLAVKKKFVNLKGFVNGILRNIARKAEENADRDSFLQGLEPDSIAYASVRYSVPEWILETFAGEFGKDAAVNAARAIEKGGPMHAWISPAFTEEEMLDAFTREGIQAEANPYFSEEEVAAYYLDGVGSPKERESFRKGGFYIQDTASTLDSLLASKVLTKLEKEKKELPKSETKTEELRVLDVCAAPGGKTLFVALSHPEAKVTCRDLSEDKVNLIIDNVRRLGPENVYPEVWDATKKHKGDEGAYDLVIADLPCSGLGVLGRKSDIKYRVEARDLLDLADLQREILQQIGSYVKPGGYLLYSTCTVNAKENDEQVSYLLKEADFELCGAFMKEALPKLYAGNAKELGFFETKVGGMQLLPQENPYHDGFYFALSKKK